MNPRLRIRTLSLLAVVSFAVVSGCLAPQARESRHAEPRPVADQYVLSTHQTRSAAGCAYEYRVFDPLPGNVDATNTPLTTVMLGHGFLRNQNTLVELARALANAGFRAVTLDFCNMRPWNGHHQRNARDLVELAATLNATSVVYAGFSAGALAALIAGSDDPNTQGVITLDLVDQADLGSNALATLSAPLIGLQGPPSSCNADGSGQRVFNERPAAPLETLPGASHCEFESPTNRWCEIACGDEDSESDDNEDRADIIRRVVTAVSDMLSERPQAGADRIWHRASLR